MSGWDGAGNFTLLHDWTVDRDAGTKVLASRHDAQDEVLRVGIEAALAKNGENAATGNLNIGNFRLTNVGAATAANDAVRAAQIQNGDLLYAADTGTADALAISLTPAETSYSAGQIFHVKKGASANTGACTLNVDTIGAKNIKLPDGSNPAAGDLPASGMLIFGYDGTNMILLAGKPATVLIADKSMTGTAVGFANIPAGAKMVVINFDTVSLSGADYFHIQIGDSGGIESTGYNANAARLPNGGAIAITDDTSGFPVKTAAAGDAVRGSMILTKMDGNKWSSSHSVRIGAGVTGNGGGVKTLSGELTQFQVGRTGASTFDAGTIGAVVYF